MRLIDAEKFELFNATCPIPKGIRSGKIAAYFYVEGCRKVLEAIDAAPTIDPESLRPTAKWEPTTVPFMDECVDCSVCGYRTIYGNGFKYCPNCGARMVNADEKHCT